MVRVTKELIQSRAEHNEGMLSNLEELSMHMQHLEKLEMFDKLCRNLKILLLQNNVISKIENLNALKRLEHLNISLNILERVEGLEGCESLEKLDLTLNFIGDLLSLETLRKNANLHELTLRGNPCSRYKGYRHFVIYTLPQLRTLDGMPVAQTEVILARQEMEKNQLRDSIERQQAEFFREWQSRDRVKRLDEYLAEAGEEDEDETLRKLWSEKGKDSPELRILMSELSLRQSKKDEKPKTEKKERALFNSKGNPLNVNDSNLKFELTEDLSRSCLVLKIFLAKSFDTSDMDADIQPWYIRVSNKRGLIFQITLLHEVCPDKTKAERSLATGNLIITAPLAQELLVSQKTDDFERFKNFKISKKNAIENVTVYESADIPQEVAMDLSEVPELEEIE
ncbi:Hypothetical predicted protein [Cloeon dipterum]|uniref:Dynein axonemal assembly factor 11-like CS domain-containing protein n=1 Tax=Cloeon dipterum TaxID=197152 RepID=A0A8S1BXM4_9INSE|nr:Hypothetical predicted protein [Cloeon dipterum]